MGPLVTGRSDFGKWLATHHRVDGIKDLQAIDIRYSTNGDRITDIKHLVIGVGERRPRRKILPVRIAPFAKLTQ